MNISKFNDGHIIVISYKTINYIMYGSIKDVSFIDEMAYETQRIFN